MSGQESCLCQGLECQAGGDVLGKQEKSLVSEKYSRESVTRFRLSNSLYQVKRKMCYLNLG